VVSELLRDGRGLGEQDNLRPVLRGHGVAATGEEILGLHAETEHKLQAAYERRSPSEVATWQMRSDGRELR
jgi:hypothetical protein